MDITDPMNILVYFLYIIFYSITYFMSINKFDMWIKNDMNINKITFSGNACFEKMMSCYFFFLLNNFYDFGNYIIS